MMRALKQQLYLSRMLQVGDEFEPMPGDVEYFRKRGRAEEVVADAPRRGRPPKDRTVYDSGEVPLDPTPAEPEVPEPTHAELMARAEELGVELPSGYVRKDQLLGLIAEAEGCKE